MVVEAMSANDTFYDDELLKRVYREHLLERFKVPDFTTPEWRAWADQWMEAVPLTAEQERENAAWRERVKKARELLARTHADYAASLNAIAEQFDVRVTWGDDEDADPDVDDYDPPHRPGYRTKDGAPPEPEQKWRTIKFARSTDMRISALPTEGPAKP